MGSPRNADKMCPKTIPSTNAHKMDKQVEIYIKQTYEKFFNFIDFYLETNILHCAFVRFSILLVRKTYQ